MIVKCTNCGKEENVTDAWMGAALEFEHNWKILPDLEFATCGDCNKSLDDINKLREICENIGKESNNLQLNLSVGTNGS